MTALVWDNTVTRLYKSGLDKGVLYPASGPGVVWNGLISVAENAVGAERTAYVADGVTYLNATGVKNYQAVLSAFSAPREFSPSIGEVEVVPGFVLTRQPRSSFGLSYRTRLGELGYEIHILYNALASPIARSYATVDNQATAAQLQWTIDATPPTGMGAFRPTAHFIVDSTKTDSAVLQAVEDFLYGTDDEDPQLPALDLLVGMFNG